MAAETLMKKLDFPDESGHGGDEGGNDQKTADKENNDAMSAEDLQFFEEMLDKEAKAAAAAASGSAGETNGGRVALQGEEKVVQQLQGALDAGDIGLRTPIGQRFTAALARDGELRKEYDALKRVPASTQKKAEFRRRWATAEFEARTEVVKSKSEAIVEEFGEVGTMMSFERLVIQEGGFTNPRAIERAKAYACECLRRGPPFVEWNSWKRTTELMVFEKVKKSMKRDVYSLERTPGV